MYEHSADRDGKKTPVLWLKKHYFAIIKGAHDAGSRGFTERRASDLSKLGKKKGCPPSAPTRDFYKDDSFKTKIESFAAPPPTRDCFFSETSGPACLSSRR